MVGEVKDRFVLYNIGRIYDYIKNNPGIHPRKKSRDLNIANGDTQYHLDVVHKLGMIKSKRRGSYKVYYTVSILGKRNEDILAILQQETPSEIILYLIGNPGSTQGEISRFVSVSAPTINWHMSVLINIGLVTRCREGRFVRYFIKGDVNDIIALLKSYYPTIWSTLSDRLAGLFLDLSFPLYLSTTHDDDQETISNAEKLDGTKQDEA